MDGDSLLDLLLGSPNDIIDLGSNLLDLLLSIETLSNLLVGLNETLELLLEAVILIIEVGHVLVKGIDLRLKVNLVPHHLLGVLLQSIDFISD